RAAFARSHIESRSPSEVVEVVGPRGLATGVVRHPLYRPAPMTGPIAISGGNPLVRRPVQVLVPVLGLVYVGILIVIIATFESPPTSASNQIGRASCRERV